MKPKILNLREALRLASILDKYIDDETTQAEVLDFVSGVVNKIEPREYLSCISLLTGEANEAIAQENPLDILACFVGGLKENQILSLVTFYRSLGLNNGTITRRN